MMSKGKLLAVCNIQIKEQLKEPNTTNITSAITKINTQYH